MKAALILVFLFRALFFSSEPSENPLGAILPPSSEIPVYLSGSVTGPCSVLTAIEYGDIEDSQGRKVGDAYFAAQLPLSDDPPDGYMGTVTLTKRTR